MSIEIPSSDEAQLVHGLVGGGLGGSRRVCVWGGGGNYRPNSPERGQRPDFFLRDFPQIRKLFPNPSKSSTTTTKLATLCDERNLVQQEKGNSPRARDLGRTVELAIQLS